MLVKADAEVRDHHRLVVFALITASLDRGLDDSGLLVRRVVNLLSRVAVSLFLTRISALLHLLCATVIVLTGSD